MFLFFLLSLIFLFRVIRFSFSKVFPITLIFGHLFILYYCLNEQKLKVHYQFFGSNEKDVEMHAIRIVYKIRATICAYHR